MLPLKLQPQQFLALFRATVKPAAPTSAPSTGWMPIINYSVMDEPQMS